MSDTKNNLAFRLIYLAIGLVLGVLFVLAPIKYAAGLTIGLGFAVFTFFQPKISYMLFFFGMLIIPNDYWNNMLILLSAFGYAALFALNFFLDKNKGLNAGTIAPSLILFTFFAVLSLFTGFGAMDSVRVFAIMLGCIIHSVLIFNFVETKEDLRILILILAAAVALTSLFGLYQYIAGIEIKAEFTDLTQSQGLSRLFSTMANSNNDAESWVMLLPFIIAMMITTSCDTKRVVLAGVIGLCVIALMLTYSRSGYLALLAAAGIFVLIVSPKLVPVGILALIIMIPFLPESLKARVLTIGKDTSSKYRLLIWEGVFRMFEDFWITGIGMGPKAFTSIYRDYAHVNAKPAMHSHNVFLSVLAEIGIGGFISFMAYLFKTFRAGIVAQIKNVDPEMKIYLAAGVASLTAFCVFSLVEYVWFYPRVMLIFWLVTGLVLSMARMNYTKEQTGLE